MWYQTTIPTARARNPWISGRCPAGRDEEAGTAVGRALRVARAAREAGAARESGGTKRKYMRIYGGRWGCGIAGVRFASTEPLTQCDLRHTFSRNLNRLSG